MPLPHVAIVSLGFPPMRHVAGTRAAKMADELRRLDHRVTVVTVDWRARPLQSGDAAEDVHVVRVDPREWYPAFDPAAHPIALEAPLALAPLRRARTLARVARWGPFAPWARRAVRALERVHERTPVAVTWAIHGDPSSHEIAYRFHRRTGVPWVADFKDPWDLFHSGRLVKPIQRIATERRLRTARALTETAEGQAKSDAATFHKDAYTIWSGYDDRLMAASTPARRSDEFSLVYTGHLSIQHDRAAIGRLLRRVRELEPNQRIELHVYGHASRELHDILASHGVADALVQHAFVPQSEAYALMRGADALLLLPATHFVPSGASVGVKELEYFASGTPVLCLGGLLPEVERVAGRLPQTLLAADADEGARFLVELLRARASGVRSARTGVVNDPAIVAHAWRAQAARLSEVLTAVAAKRRPSLAPV